MTIVTVGIGLAKNVFAVHGVDATGKALLIRPHVPRGKLLELIATLPPCLIGMEARSGAHHWARAFAQFLDLALELLEPRKIRRGRPFALPGITLVLAHPSQQRLRRAADLGRYRFNRRPLRWVICVRLLHHPHGPLADLGGKLH